MENKTRARARQNYPRKAEYLSAAFAIQKDITS